MTKVLFRSLLLTALVSSIVYFYMTLPDVSVLKKQNPKNSALMELRTEEYRKKGIRAPRQQIWVSYGAISENLKKLSRRIGKPAASSAEEAPSPCSWQKTYI